MPSARNNNYRPAVNRLMSKEAPDLLPPTGTAMVTSSCSSATTTAAFLFIATQDQANLPNWLLPSSLFQPLRDHPDSMSPKTSAAAPARRYASPIGTKTACSICSLEILHFRSPIYQSLQTSRRPNMNG